MNQEEMPIIDLSGVSPADLAVVEDAVSTGDLFGIHLCRFGGVIIKVNTKNFCCSGCGKAQSLVTYGKKVKFNHHTCNSYETSYILYDLLVQRLAKKVKEQEMMCKVVSDEMQIARKFRDMKNETLQLLKKYRNVRTRRRFLNRHLEMLTEKIRLIFKKHTALNIEARISDHDIIQMDRDMKEMVEFMDTIALRRSRLVHLVDIQYKNYPM